MAITALPSDAAGDLVTSSYCSSGGCVGVRFTSNGVEVVDTKGGTALLRFDHDEWSAFVEGVKNGDFDVATTLASGGAPWNPL